MLEHRGAFLTLKPVRGVGMPVSRICSVDGCDKPQHSHRFCGAHYKRFKRHGDPLKGRTLRGEPQKFFTEVAITHTGDDCLVWPFGQSAGYGVIVQSGKQLSVHRLICEAQNGPAPTAIHEAAHSCGVKLCCNKHHLRWATPAENKSDEIVHGTRQYGERHANSKISKEDVIEIRRLAALKELTQHEIAELFGIDQTQVSNIHLRKQWAELP